jgi:hypothetical protein
MKHAGVFLFIILFMIALLAITRDVSASSSRLTALPTPTPGRVATTDQVRQAASEWTSLHMPIPSTKDGREHDLRSL